FLSPLSPLFASARTRQPVAPVSARSAFIIPFSAAPRQRTAPRRVVFCSKRGVWLAHDGRRQYAAMGRNLGRPNLVPGGRWTRVPGSDDSHNLLLEEHLVLRDAQKGDRQAFAALVERYWDRLYRWLYHLARDRHAAEDLTQEAFCKALANLDRF